MKMTTLLIQTESTPLTVNFPSLVQMTNEQFYEFCQANGDLRIERTANGEVIIIFAGNLSLPNEKLVV